MGSFDSGGVCSMGLVFIYYIHRYILGSRLAAHTRGPRKSPGTRGLESDFQGGQCQRLDARGLGVWPVLLCGAWDIRPLYWRSLYFRLKSSPKTPTSSRDGVRHQP